MVAHTQYSRDSASAERKKLWNPTKTLGIINPDPGYQRITCIGYAPSQGRRCRNPINAGNRMFITNTLDEIAYLHPDSPAVRSRLRAIAGPALCVRCHQGQAETVISQWQRDIQQLELPKIKEEKTSKPARSSKKERVVKDQSIEDVLEQLRETRELLAKLQEEVSGQRHRDRGYERRKTKVGNYKEEEDDDDDDDDEEEDDGSDDDDEEEEEDDDDDSDDDDEEEEERRKSEERERYRAAMRQEKKRLEKERLKKERLEEERLEKKRLKKERLEKERLEEERLEKKRLKKERLEKERLEKERLEQERLEQERIQRERIEKERLEKERREREEEKRREQADSNERIRKRAQKIREEREREKKEKEQKEKEEWNNSWTKYQERWVQFRASASGEKSVRDAVPWPVKSGSYRDVNASNVKEFLEKAVPRDADRAKLLRRECRNWHPDVVCRLPRIDQATEVDRMMFDTICRVVTELLNTSAGRSAEFLG